MRTLIPTVLGCCLLLAGCESDNNHPPAHPDSTPVPARTQVYAVNYPLAWLGTMLGGDLVDVSFPAPPDIDPATWEPGPDIIARYREADVVLLNGGGYARWVSEAGLPQEQLLDTSITFNQVRDSTQSAVGAQPSTDSAAAWLDPMLMTEQARAITRKLVELHPEARETLEERLVKVRGRTGKWNTTLHRIVKALEGAPVLFSHPVYQYLEQRYPINGASLHWEPDSALTAEDWAELDTLRETHPAGIMLWEDTPSPAIAAGLAERNILVAVFRPQANRSDGGDYGTVMDANIEAFNRAAKTLLGEE